MSRLLVHVEGQTEETFVNELLCPHLTRLGWSMVSARLLGNARRRDRRGGIKSWDSARTEIARHLREDAGRIVTTMVDYCGMPRTGSRAWPGREHASSLSFPDKARTVEDALSASVHEAIGHAGRARRFVPYVMMHEFEALLFSDCAAFGRGIGRPHLGGELQQIRDAFGSPEEIDDSPETAPSKRVERLVRGYEKPLLGTLAALEIGLGTMRRECPHFGSWLDRLEQLPSAGA
jgi:hypothetical protein